MPACGVALPASVVCVRPGRAATSATASTTANVRSIRPRSRLRWVSSLMQPFYRFEWTGGNPSARWRASVSATVSLRLRGAVTRITPRILISSLPKIALSAPSVRTICLSSGRALSSPSCQSHLPPPASLFWPPCCISCPTSSERRPKEKRSTPKTPRDALDSSAQAAE